MMTMSMCVLTSVQTLLSKRDNWKEEDEDEDIWFEDDDEDFVGGAGESLASAQCLSPASTKLSLDCDQINQYLDRGNRIILDFCLVLFDEFIYYVLCYNSTCTCSIQSVL